MNTATTEQTTEHFPKTFRYERVAGWIIGAGICVSGAVVLDNVVTEDTRCIADSPNGWVDVNITQCDDVLSELID